MTNNVTPIKDAYNRVIDFIVEHECEACKKRKRKIKAVARSVRDRLRGPRRKA